MCSQTDKRLSQDHRKGWVGYPTFDFNVSNFCDYQTTKGLFYIG